MNVMMNKILKEDIHEIASLDLWSNFKNSTILITGATGMVGAYLALSIYEANKVGSYNIRPILLGRNSDKAEQLFGSTKDFYSQDIRSPLTIDEPVDFIIHTASPVGPTMFENQPVDVISVNVESTLSLLDYAVKHNCKRFLLASTHEIYGNVEGVQFETSALSLADSMKHRSCYILGKQVAENILASYSKQHGIHTMSARLSRLYGPLMNLESGLFVCDFMKNVLSDDPVNISGNPTLIRPLTYIKDSTIAMLTILAYGENSQAYNVQAEEIPTIFDIATSLSSNVQVKKTDLLNLERSGHWLDAVKLKSLGWEQTVSLVDGLQRTLDNLK